MTDKYKNFVYDENEEQDERDSNAYNELNSDETEESESAEIDEYADEEENENKRKGKKKDEEIEDLHRKKDKSIDIAKDTLTCLISFVIACVAPFLGAITSFVCLKTFKGKDNRAICITSLIVSGVLAVVKISVFILLLQLVYNANSFFAAFGKLIGG